VQTVFNVYLPAEKKVMANQYCWCDINDI